MNVTITITGTCAGGNHVLSDVTENGVTRLEVFEKADLLAADDDPLAPDERRAIVKAVRRAAKAGNAKTFAQLKTLCTNLSLSL